MDAVDEVELERRTDMVGVRLRPAERRLLLEAAAERGKSISELLREFTKEGLEKTKVRSGRLG